MRPVQLQDGAPSTRLRGLWLFVGGLVLTTLLCLAVSGGHPAAALVPLLGFSASYAVYKLPLKVPATLLFAGAFLLEIPSDIFAAGLWKSPLHMVGALLFGQLKHTIPVGALVFMGLDLVLIGLFALHAYRRATGNQLDSRGAVHLPSPLLWSAWAALLGCAFAFLWGMAHGGSFRFSLWQIQRIIYLPLVFLLLNAAYPNASVAKRLGMILVGSACVRAVLAIYLRRLFPDAEYATTHPDSMLFAITGCILVIRWLEDRSRRSLTWLLAVSPLLIAGMIANDRRLVWVELAVALLVVLAVSPRTRLKVFLMRGALYALPLLLGYVAAGWSSGSKIFAPVATLRSVVDSQSDTSTLWRDLENFNLVMTIRHNPLVGLGLGRPYEFVVPLPDVTEFYELEPYAPHNSILGLWAYTGYVGFALQWATLIVLVYLSVRICRVSNHPEHRTVALTCLAAVVIYMVHLYGDLALGTWASVFLIAAAMVVCGKLAVQVGAWPDVARNRARSAPNPSEGSFVAGHQP